MKKVFVFALLLLTPTLYAADTSRSTNSVTAIKDYQQTYDYCIENSGPINNASVTACAVAAGDEAAVDISRLYDIVYQKINEHSRGDALKFVESHQAWEKYVEIQCQLATAYIGSPMFYVCPMQLSAARANELREMAE